MNLYVYHYEDKFGDECECEIYAFTRKEADKLLAEVDADALDALLEQPDVYENVSPKYHSKHTDVAYGFDEGD